MDPRVQRARGFGIVAESLGRAVDRHALRREVRRGFFAGLGDALDDALLVHREREGLAHAHELGAEVAGVAFVVELTFLPGRERLAGYDVLSLVSYDSEDVGE